MLVNLISTASSVVEMIYPHSPGNESFCNATREPAEAGRGQARSSQPRSRSPCAARPHPRCRHHRLGRRGGCQTASLGGPSSSSPLPSLSIDSALEPHPLPVHVPRGPRLLDEPQTGCSSPPPRLLEIYVIKQFRHHPPRNSLHYRCHLHGRTSTQRRPGRPAPRGSRPLLRLCWGQQPSGRAGAGRWGGHGGSVRVRLTPKSAIRCQMDIRCKSNQIYEAPSATEKSCSTPRPIWGPGRVGAATESAVRQEVQ